MSMNDLEAEMSRWLELEQLAQAHQQQIQAQKEARQPKVKRAPLYRPERPAKCIKVVTLLLSPAKPVPLSEWKGSMSDWATQRVEREYEVDSLAVLTAEFEAIKLARKDGYLWHATLGTVEKREAPKGIA